MEFNNMLGKGDYQNLEEQDEQFQTEIHSKITWDHIQNLDKFFSNVYYFHQQHGFFVTFIEFLLQVMKFFFIIWILSVFSDLCFSDIRIVRNDTISYQYFYNPIIFRSNNQFTTMIVVVSLLLLILFIINCIPKLHQFYSICKFYRYALKIKDDSIPDKTWSDVLSGLKEVQSELQLCVHKPLLDELDIYHRILRRQNYLIAMMAKEIFPTEVPIPLFGPFVIVTKYYLDSIKYMLFKCPYKSPFGDHWQLRAEYKDLACRNLLIKQISIISLVIGLCQLLISPICFMYLLVTKACTYGHSLKINPGQCINREITPYGRLFLAHFNELPHEFSARVSRAYGPANAYLDSFISKTVVALARLVRFLAGGVIIIGFFVSMSESRFLLVPHMITAAAVVTLAYSVSIKLIPDESLVVCPSILMGEVLKHVHYMPDHWRESAHTRKVYNEFSKLFQPKIMSIIKELLSCFSTPLVFIFMMPKYSPKMVDFLRNYTTDMHGVGDICSFARMDVNKHGSVSWAMSVPDAVASASRGDPLRHGKVELSLVNFHSNNPGCPLGGGSAKFVNELKSHINMTMPSLGQVSTFPQSLGQYSSILMQGDPHLRNASRHVGPSTSSYYNGGSAINNYFYGHNISSMNLSHASYAFENYRSMYDPMRDVSRCEVNMNISLLHGIHEQRRMGHTIQPVNQIISEVEEEVGSMTPTDPGEHFNLCSVPTP